MDQPPIGQEVTRIYAANKLTLWTNVENWETLLLGFNRRKMEDERRRAAEKEASARRALDPQVRADAERLVADWNERQAK